MKKILIVVVCLLGVAAAVWKLGFSTATKSLQFANAATTNTKAISLDGYASVLKTYVTEKGMVNYQALLAKKAPLDAFAASLGTLEPQAYEALKEPEKIALLLNAYNALTLEAILSNYPIKPSLSGSVLYPRNSIRQIPGVWDKLEFQVLGKATTLDNIEHQMLRKQFAEPRIHMALVCASMGCPTLRAEPYIAERLSEQLDDQTRKFLSDPLKFRIDRQARTVYLSPLFKWYGGDFVGKYGTDKFAGHNDAERAVLNYFGTVLPPSESEFLNQDKFEIKYLDYDWSLNEQTGA